MAQQPAGGGQVEQASTVLGHEKAFDQEGGSPSQANVTSLKSTVVTAFP
jgi:hypothetical protein